MRLAFWKTEGMNKDVQEPKDVQTKPIAPQEGASKAAQASIAYNQVQPSKKTMAWNWTKDNLPKVALFTAFVAVSIFIPVGIHLGGATSALAIAGYTLGTASATILGSYKYKSTEKNRAIDKHAKQLYNSVFTFDCLDPNSNKYVSAAELFLESKRAIEKDLVNTNLNIGAFIARIVSAAKPNPYDRINTEDGRYGFKLTNNNIITFEKFVQVLVKNEIQKVKKSYDEELKSYVETFSDALKEDNIMMSKKIGKSINKAADKISGRKEYNRLLNKQLSDVTVDLINEIKKQLSAKYIKNELNKMNNLVKNRYKYWGKVNISRDKIKKDNGALFNKKTNEWNKLEQKLKEFNNIEANIEKEKVSLLDIVRNRNNSHGKIQDAEDKIAEMDQKRKEINEQKEKIQKEIEELKKQLAEIEKNLGCKYLIELNARRKELGRLLGQELEDLELPSYPSFGDKVKYWAPRFLVGAFGLAAIGTAAYYAMPYVVSDIKNIEEQYLRNWRNKTSIPESSLNKTSIPESSLNKTSIPEPSL